MTKSKTNHDQWQGKPGGYDALNTSRLFASDNAFGIPQLRREPFAHIGDHQKPGAKRGYME